MFDHTCIRHFTIGIIDNRIPLIIVTVKCLRLKSHRTILKRSESVTKIFIDHPRKYDLVCNIRILSTKFKKVCSRKNIRFFKHFFHDRSIAADRDSLISVIEIVIIVNKSEWQTFDNKCRKFCTLSSPLFLCITLDQLLIDISSTKKKCLFLQILWICDSCLFALFFNNLFCQLFFFYFEFCIVLFFHYFFVYYFYFLYYYLASYSLLANYKFMHVHYIIFCKKRKAFK